MEIFLFDRIHIKLLASGVYLSTMPVYLCSTESRMVRVLYVTYELINVFESNTIVKPTF